jgi:hypothetical protein
MNITDSINNFNRLYRNLDEDTQVKLDHFIAGIEEVGQFIIGETFYHGTDESLNEIMPCLRAISQTITSTKIELDDNKYIFKLTWTPNDFVIPPEVIIRANERYYNNQLIYFNSGNNEIKQSTGRCCSDH